MFNFRIYNIYPKSEHYYLSQYVYYTYNLVTIYIVKTYICVFLIFY